MLRSRISISIGLIIFCIVAVCIWMLPVILSGYSYEIPHLLPARNFAETGTFTMEDDIGRYVVAAHHPAMTSAKDGRLSTVMFAFFSRWIAWDNAVLWSLLSAILIALSLIPLWLATSRLFGQRIAWVTLGITSLMPIYWKEAVYLSNFHFAFLFMMWSIAAFVLLRRWHWRAIAVSAVFYGLSIASKDLFLIFAPWYVLMYVWNYRANWLHIFKGCLLFFGLAFSVYVVPYVGDIQEHGYPLNWNLARVWPGAEEIANSTYLHLYPDAYTYFFDRESFDVSILEKASDVSLLERIQMQKTLRAYGVGDWNVFKVFLHGAWLFLNSIPSFFHISTIGGVFLWILILPGSFFLWKRDRKMAVSLLGLVLTTYIVIRFVLGYNREHFMDIGWVFAILAAQGVVHVSDVFSKQCKKLSVSVISIILLAFIGVQLVQANRQEFARLYRGSFIQDSFAVAESMVSTPETSVIATPLHSMRVTRITYLSGRTTIIFAPETIEKLLDDRKLAEVFEQYGVTHISRYEDELTARMIRATSVRALDDDSPGPQSPRVTPAIQYLLHKVY